MHARSQISRSIPMAAVVALGALTARADRPAATLEAGGAAAPADELSAREQRELLAMIEGARPMRRGRPVRFSNGPRAVPRARGLALSRALALGIGDHLSTKQLLWSRPSKELLAAVWHNWQWFAQHIWGEHVELPLEPRHEEEPPS